MPEIISCTSEEALARKDDNADDHDSFEAFKSVRNVRQGFSNMSIEAQYRSYVLRSSFRWNFALTKFGRLLCSEDRKTRTHEFDLGWPSLYAMRP